MTQNPELRQLISVVQIENVRLLESAAKTTINVTQIKPSELLIRHGATLARGKDETGRFIVHATVEARVVLRQESNATVGSLPVWDVEPLIAARFVHELTYFVPLDASFSDEALSEFARINGVFNAWPYWRQLFQAATNDMGLPRVVFPVFRAGNFDGRLKPERGDSLVDDKSAKASHAAQASEAAEAKPLKAKLRKR